MSALAPGFAHPAHDAARAFRAIMEALARPGTIHDLAGPPAPAPLSPAASAVLLTLTDRGTPVHLAPSHDNADLRAWLAFHTGAPLVVAEEAHFALGTWATLQPSDRFAIGTPDYPDRSATLIIEVPGFDGSTRLTGPGIREALTIGLPDPAAFAANHARYPLGWDAVLTTGTRICGLPRSTEVR
ncbi:phosphonate C-P lyase system protein PhnH [Paracoccus suum]|uniref:Phosphonate C-P lyase system protein PhnH n=1 Tax=Paracoccus suum TaxID=2259340 RepID=A0A344PH21_9RHOB|nr:phosphonate C-P lyase system protein PhnH [Paracoccus suum]AXC48676.1 phosphonate C-P lyase system protein PhnH [Paracoccus suum]